MTKATVTLLRQMKLEKPLGLGLGGSLVTEAYVHFNTTGLSIHAEDVRLKRLTRILLFPAAVPSVAVANIANGSIATTKKSSGYASIAIYHIGTLATGGGSAKIAAGTKQDYYGLFIGD